MNMIEHADKRELMFLSWFKEQFHRDFLTHNEYDLTLKRAYYAGVRDTNDAVRSMRNSFSEN